MLTVFIDRKNKLTFSFDGKSIVRYIPTKHQRSFVNEMFSNSPLMFKDEDGNEHKLPVVIHDNVRKITTTLNDDSFQYEDIYAGVPNGVRYIPNKLMTFERDRQDWLLTRVKRTFNSYDNKNITEQEFKTEMRVLFAR